MKRILFSIVTISLVTIFAITASSAFFSDTETSTGNTFTAGAVDLLINDQNDPIGLVDIQDLKPGDDYFIEKRLFVQNDAYVFLQLKDLLSDQGTQTEPEVLEESQTTPKWDIENYLTYDLSFLDGEVLIDFDHDNLLPEVTSCWIPLGVIPGGVETTIVQSFHLPDDITNWAQGDILTFTEEFYAEQARNNPNPTPPDTGSGRVWNPITKNCEDCENGAAWADSVESQIVGTLKNGGAITDPNRINPANALGAANWVPGTGTNFYSVGDGGQLVLKFANIVVDKPGDDLSVHEATNGRSTYPEESVLVEISQDGITWHVLGSATSEPGGGGDGVSWFDISASPIATFQFVRLTDNTNFAPHTSDADGFDLDAVDAQSQCILN